MGLRGTAPAASIGEIATAIAADVAKNAAAALPGFRQLRAKRPRSAPGDITAEWLQRHAFLTLDRVSQLGYSVENRAVAEIGVGDSLASGLAFLAAGAASYTASDPFLGDVESARNKDIYQRVREAWIENRNQRWPESVDVERLGANAMAAVRQPVEDLEGVETFDIICSTSVVEHVWRIDRFARAMRRLLRPHGVALHWVDFGPHGQWTRFDDKLTFLRVPEPLWRTGVTRNVPTRLRLSEIVAALRDADLAVEIAAVGYFEPSELPPDPARLGKRFRSMGEEDLRARTALLTLTRDSES